MRGQSKWVPRRRHVAALVVIALLTALVVLLWPRRADGQYFGRNKVQYDRFAFRVLTTPHFDVHFYPVEAAAVNDAARMAERWYYRHQRLFREEIRRSPLIFYADQPDFQQSNVIETFVGQETGGVTEGIRTRVMMPLTGVSSETDHVLGHELVHVFQYRIAQSTENGSNGMEALPLWFVEGMAEYLSVGRRDPQTALWMRDAIAHNALPSIAQLADDSRYFPYRYGAALWAYIGGTYGDSIVAPIFRTALRRGWSTAIDSVLHLPVDSLSRQWHRALRAELRPPAIRTAPDAIGTSIATTRAKDDQHVSPSLSPDGQRMAFFSSRSLFGMDLYVAEIATGRIIKRLTDVAGDPHYDALSVIETAGSWSPDGSRIAFVVYAAGGHRLDIVNLRTGRTEQRIHPQEIGAMSDPAWSPDGRQIVFSGQVGGVRDLFLYDLAARRTTRLTRGPAAEFQPAWSADGTWLAYVTDGGEGFDTLSLSYPSPRIVLRQLSTGEERRLAPLVRGKQINPQFTPDGSALLFVSDPEGVSDVYRYTLATGVTSRVTAITTGVTGITALSPAISIARSTGTMALSVFDNGSYRLRILPAASTAGQPLLADAATAPDGVLGVLPPQAALATSLVSAALQHPKEGLRTAPFPPSRAYRPGLSAEYVTAASIGMSFGSGYGSGATGGVAVGFSDMLGNRVAEAALQAQGEIEDTGGQIIYLDRSRRLNWGMQAYHVPVVGAYATSEPVRVAGGGGSLPGTLITQQITRVYYDDARLLAQYPRSSTRRVEMSAGVQRIGVSGRLDSIIVVGGVVAGRLRTRIPGPAALSLVNASVAYVGDYARFGFVSPLAGARYRLEFAPAVGSLTFQSVLGDYRRYFFMAPLTLAVRGMHVGRYGVDAENERLPLMFVGQPSLIRGYDATDFTQADCVSDSESLDPCPQYTRLAGSRVGVINAELRIPLLGTKRFGLIPFSAIPVEVAPFVDAGVAWTRRESASFRVATDTPDRVPVFSAGVATRISILNAIVLELYWVHPYQRVGRGSYMGFQITPGW
jgi:hypothetical protein